MPMLSSIVSISSGGITVRMVSSIAANLRSVSSMRVPGGAAHVQLDEPRVDAREEVAPDEGEERERAGDERRGSRPTTSAAVLRAPSASQLAVEHPQPLEAPLERGEEASGEGRGLLVVLLRVMLGLLAS